jgi:hypothetical protein
MRPYTHKQHGAIRVELIAAIATVLAAFFAGLTYYMAYHKSPKPFEPSVSTGTPVLRDTFGFLTIALSLPVTNNGETPGCISDIGLTLQSKTLKTKWHYFPAWQINMERYLKAPASKEDPFVAVEAPVSPIRLPGKSTHQQVILFLPRTPDTPKTDPLRVQDIKPGESYIVSVFLLKGDANCQTSNTSKYEQYTSTDFVLEASHIENLSKGVTVLPLDTVRDSLRKQFVSGP